LKLILDLVDRSRGVGHGQLAVEVDPQAVSPTLGRGDAGLDPVNVRDSLVLRVLDGRVAVLVAALVRTLALADEDESSLTFARWLAAVFSPRRRATDWRSSWQ